MYLLLGLVAMATVHVDYSTFLGGSGDEGPVSIAVDSAGNSYVTGNTNSPDFPLTSTAFGVATRDHGCTFVTKLSSSGGTIIWSICLANATGKGIDVDPSGNVYVLTDSSITKLSPAADRIVYTKPLRASGAAIKAGADGSVYVTGNASTDFVPTVGAYQTAFAPGACHGGAGVGMTPYPCPDAFVTKLNPDGSVAFATYLGGSGPDNGRALVVDSAGNVWVTGDTVSADFPTTAGAFQTKYHGEVDLGPVQFGDAFVTKLDPTGSKLLYSTYLGGSAPDAGFSITLDGSGAAYVAGATQSIDFPTTTGAFQRTYGGGSPIPALFGDAFVVKFSAAGSVVYSTFLGGSQGESASLIAVDAHGSAYVNAFSTTLSVLSPDGSTILQSAPMSGLFTLDAVGALHFANRSLGYSFFPTAGATQPKFGGGTYDVTVVKIDFNGAASPWVTSIVNAAGLRTGTPSFYPVFDIAPGEIISLFGSGFDGDTKVLIDGLTAPIFYVQSDQINAVVPFGIKGPLAAITIQGSGQTLGPGTMNVFDAVPAVFTISGTGKGQAAVLNQDGSVNSSTNPASRGSVISAFMTGAGRMTPVLADGSSGPLSPPFPIPVLGVGASVGEVLYAGAAPGLIAGAVQVNIRIREDLTPGDLVPLIIYVGNFASGFGGDATIAVR